MPVVRTAVKNQPSNRASRPATAREQRSWSSVRLMGTSMPAPDDRNWRLSDIAVGAAHRARWLPGGRGPLVAECLEDAPAQGVGRLLRYVVELHRQQPLRAADGRPDEA